MFVSLIFVCSQELSNQLRAGVRLQPSLAGPMSKADDLLIEQLRCQRCHWEWVNTPPLQRDKTLYFSPLQLCKVSLAICVFNLALAFSICLQNDWLWNREESQEAPAGLGAPANRWVRVGLAGVKAYSQGAVQGLANDIPGHLVAVQGCWASCLRAGGMLVSKAVTWFWCLLCPALLCTTPVDPLVWGRGTSYWWPFPYGDTIPNNGPFPSHISFTATRNWSTFSRLPWPGELL